MVLNWHRVVGVYSECALSFEKDRLPALAGLAEQAQRFRRGRYLAGLWEDSLLRDLYWMAMDRNTKTRNTDSSSPTWSWASATTRIAYALDWSRDSSMPLCEILQVIYTPLNPLNPRGQVSQAKLTIRGHVVQILLRDGAIDIQPGWGQELEIFNYNISLPGPGLVEEGFALFCLTINRFVDTCFALILRCIDDKSQVYERIGIVEGHMSGLSRFGVKKSHLGRYVGLFPTWRSNMHNIEGLTGYEKEMHGIGLKASEISKALEVAKNLDWDPADVIEVDFDRYYNGPGYLAMLTPEQAAQAKSHPVVREIHKKSTVPLGDPNEVSWFLPPEEAEKKARGEEFKEFYLGKIVNIV